MAQTRAPTKDRVAGRDPRQPTDIRVRSPLRAAILAAVTVSVYGFWWWWDVNRQLRALGQPARPWRSLAAVTIGWLAIAPPFLSVHHTTAMIAAAQQRVGVVAPAQPSVAVALAGVFAVGLVAFYLTSLAALSIAFLVGLVPPLMGMVLVGYVQAAINRAIRGGRS